MARIPPSRPTPCLDCGTLVPRNAGWQPVKLCAPCKTTSARAEAERKVERHAARAAARDAVLAKVCEWRLSPFTATTIRQKYCSEPHNNIAKSARRKARLRGAAVGEPPSLWAIYERDGGRCALCLGDVDRTIRWPDGRAASIDHIVPVSRGGTDGSSNVQLAHLVCNIRKNDKLPGESKRPSRGRAA